MRIVLAGVFSALTILLGLFPSVGLIPVPTPAGNATTLHIPAIVAGILGGPIVGLLVGLTFGLFSFLRATLPLFKDPLVAILPRLFIGVTAWAAYAGAMRANRGVMSALAVLTGVIGLWFGWQVHAQRALLGWGIMALVLLALAGLLYLLSRGTRETTAAAVAAVVGSFTNTALVLGMAAYLGYLPTEGVLLVATTHGIPEAIVAAVIAVAVVGAVRGTRGRQKSSL
jgi:uncharacterized membrane protein